MSSTKTLNNLFTFSSTEGQQLVQKILVDGLLFEPHNDQIAGVCKTLDGINILIVSVTGSGKTGYFFMVLIVIITINNNLQLCPSVKFKKDPAMIVLCPTNALEVEMRDKMITFGLTVIALNRDTIEEAQQLHQEDLWETAHTGIAVILTNMEQLSLRGFAKLTNDKSGRISVLIMPAFGCNACVTDANGGVYSKMHWEVAGGVA
ncbi:hypothetical protein L208DRAFT_1239175 [Tricholoma matsutake]|nr:hypothetical protein L208DRAFT_1239175 [Tricholoma matsutake 945]